MRIFSAIIIIFTIALTALPTYLNSAHLISRHDSNAYYLKKELNNCKAVDISNWGKRTILRIDDPHADFYTDVVIKMTNDANSLNAPVVLAVIPHDLEKDGKLYDFLEMSNCKIEIALHGWDHSANPPEFSNLSMKDAYIRIQRGKSVLEKVTEEPLVTFVPPENKYSEGTRQAALNAGFKVISSEAGGEWFFGYTSSTYDFDINELVPVDQVIKNCDYGFKEHNLCVIMLHPQDYVTDGKLDDEKYKNYLELLNRLISQNASFVTFKDFFN